MQPHYNTVFSARGGIVPSCTITVRNQAGDLAAIFSDNGVTPKSNPFVSGTDGEYSFYAANGRYSVSVEADDYESEGQEVILFDPADASASGVIAFNYSASYVAGSIGRWLKDLATSAGSTFIGFLQAGTDAVVRTLQSKLRETVSVTDFGASGNGSAPAHTQIQAAIDYVYGRGGGKVLVPAGRYLLGATLVVPQRVVLEGETASFVNQYGSGGIAEPLGSVLFAAPGLNADVVRIECRLYVDGGLLKETTHGRRNQDARHGGGMRGITVWGNRSVNAAPSEVELNNAGHGIHVRGARYVTLENVISMFCAEEGLRTGSLDYGTGLFGVNNARFAGVSCLSNHGHGMYLNIGDSRIENPNCGYNGGYGIIENMGNSTINGGLSWNNIEGGVYSGPNGPFSVSSISGLHSYDNDGPGFWQANSPGTNTLSALIGCVGRGNGRDATKAATHRSNFLISSTSSNWHWSGCLASAYDQAGVITSTYGFYVGATSSAGVFGADNISRAATISDYFFADTSVQLTHAGTTRHPGFLATSDIDLNTYRAKQIGAFSFAAWSGLGGTVTGGVLPLTGFNSLWSLSFTGPQTVTEITATGAVGIQLAIVRNAGADAVTFVHDPTKLRCANGVDLVLNQYESAMFLFISGTIWQQVGGAA